MADAGADHDGIEPSGVVELFNLIVATPAGR
jgi:hypothetical protein